VAPGDPAALATVLRSALEMPPAARAEIGARARAHVLANYTTRAMQDATLDIYRDLP
jgi:glycosyltransferase involved in cell wall biosynthesis